MGASPCTSTGSSPTHARLHGTTATYGILMPTCGRGRELSGYHRARGAGAIAVIRPASRIQRLQVETGRITCGTQAGRGSGQTRCHGLQLGSCPGGRHMRQRRPAACMRSCAVHNCAAPAQAHPRRPAPRTRQGIWRVHGAPGGSGSGVHRDAAGRAVLRTPSRRRCRCSGC